MAAKTLVFVQVLDSLPSHGFGGLILNVSDIKYAAQEYFAPLVEDEDENGYQPVSEYTEGAIPVVHVWLKYSLAAFPITSVNEPALAGADVPQTPYDRQTEIWIQGFLENFYADVMGEMPPADKTTLGTPLMDYYSLVVTDTTISFDISPVVDADTYFVSVNGSKLQDSNNTSISITGLTPGKEYAIIMQARKNDVAYNYSELNLMAITTTDIT